LKENQETLAEETVEDLAVDLVEVEEDLAEEAEALAEEIVEDLAAEVLEEVNHNQMTETIESYVGNDHLEAKVEVAELDVLIEILEVLLAADVDLDSKSKYFTLQIVLF
jgi:hypothetical protein